MKKKVLSVLLAAVMIVPSLLLTSCGVSVTPPEGTYTRMTVDINPSVEFMIDDQNKVVSVTALNDDGSILIAGEAFIGKTPEEAAELMVTLAGETGYLVGGSVEAGENEVKISISGDSKYAEQLTKQIERTAANTLKALDIEGTIAKVDALHTEALQSLAMQTALFTEEEVAGMSEEQLYSAIAAGRVETALLLTEEMREAYYAAKESRISFAESEATAEIINAMGGAYQLIYLGYKTAVDAYSAAITALDDFRYDQLVSPESAYQKKLAELREAKTELLQEKNRVASLEEGSEERIAAEKRLQAAEEAYDNVLKTYEELGTSLNDTLVGLIETLRESEAFLRSLEDKFSDNIKEELQAKAYALEDAMNAAKDGFFADFEAAHKEDIASMEQSLIEQKNRLKAAAVGSEG